MFHQLGGLLVQLGIEHAVRMAVGGQEALQRVDAAVAARADDDRAAGILFDQADAAQDQRAHDALAQVGVRDEQRAQRVGRYHQHFDVALGHAVAQRRAAGQLRHFAAELAALMGGDVGGVAQPVVAADDDAALEHQHQAEAGLARFEDHLAVVEVAHVAEAHHVLDVDRAERGENLVAALLHVDQGTRRGLVRCFFGEQFRGGGGHDDSGK